MKKILFCTTIILLSIVVACTKIGGNDKDDPGSTPDKPKSELKVNAAILNFTVEGGSNTISVTSTDVWTAVENLLFLGRAKQCGLTPYQWN